MHETLALGSFLFSLGHFTIAVLSLLMSQWHACALWRPAPFFCIIVQDTKKKESAYAYIYITFCQNMPLHLPTYLKGLLVSTKSLVTRPHMSSIQPCTSLSSYALSFSTASIAYKVEMYINAIQLTSLFSPQREVAQFVQE